MTASRLPLWTFLATTLLFVASVAVSVNVLPAQVAIHFDAAGDPDDWISRTTHITGFIALGLGLSAFMLGIAYLIRFFPPSTLNVPRQAYWRAPENYPRACAFFFHHTFWLAALNNLLLRDIGIGTGLFVTGLLVWCVFLLRFYLKAPRT